MFTSKRIPIILLVVSMLCSTAPGMWPGVTRAQEDAPPAQFGDPPLAERITISAPDEAGIVTISGEVGAVFPGAFLAVRNMYTGETVYPRAEITGAFVATIYGPGNTPFWISPAQRIDPGEQNRPGSLPGGPGVILYGPLHERLPAVPQAVTVEAGLPSTPIRVDGDAAEWPALSGAYPIDVGAGQSALVYAVANQQSLYLAVAPASADAPLPADYSALEIELVVDGRLFTVQLDPLKLNSARAFEGESRRDIGRLAGLSVQAEAVEIRLPRSAFTGWAAPITVRGVRFVQDSPVPPLELFLQVPELDQVDTRAVEPLPMAGDALPFTLSGSVGGGSGRWQAAGRINQQAFAKDETLQIELQVTMTAPQLHSELVDLQLGADLMLEPVIADSGAQTMADRAMGNGWSGVRTSTGLPVDGVSTGRALGSAAAQGTGFNGELLTFSLQWTVPLKDVPAGVYVPSLQTFAAVAGLSTTWAGPGIMGDGAVSGVEAVRLPAVVRVGEPSGNHLLWTLFHDQPSGNGARGVLAAEDAAGVALSNRVAFQPLQYILPRVDAASGEPIPYPLEPYLPAILGNSFDRMIAPLLPLDVASGELSVSVALPDGTIDDLGTVPLKQNRLSTLARDEAQVFGATSPVDVYRLTTLDPAITGYTFEQDGRHVITMTGTVTDVWGNTYTGGGTYEVWLADPLELRMGVLSGTPFEVGDTYLPALQVLPAFPAEVSVRLWAFPLDGSAPLTYQTSGQANTFGVFQPGQDVPPWVLTMPGEYVVDTTASYVDRQGRLWMSSVRGAGVIASPEPSVLARGGRGVADLPVESRQAWYALDNSMPDLRANSPSALLNWPYFSGDVLWVADGAGGFGGMVRLTDVDGRYERWLREAMPYWRAGDGMTLEERANEDELPPVYTADHDGAYVYISAARPGLTARQMVMGSEASDLIQPGWTLADPYSGQRGGGINGDRPGDYTFLFGGAVLHGEASEQHQAAIYSALAVVIGADDPRGERVYPPMGGADNGPDGRPLLTVDGTPYEMFFLPTGFQPGQVLSMGQRLQVAGQAAPTLPVDVTAEVIAPSGRVYEVSGQANAVGYFYNPVQDVLLDEPGLWRVRLRMGFDGRTSAGQVYEPVPEGGFLGLDEVLVAVLPEDTLPLTVNTPALDGDETTQPAIPFAATVLVPEGWTDVRLDLLAGLSSVVMEYISQPVLAGSYSYTYNPRQLSLTFPNLDVAVDGTGAPNSADTVTLTFIMTGADAAGQPAVAARTLTLFGSRLVALHDRWPVPEEAAQ